jgi:hypothetical protein
VFSPALSQPPSQDRYQFRLSVVVESFGSLQGIGKAHLLTHGDLLTTVSNDAEHASDRRPFAYVFVRSE